MFTPDGDLLLHMATRKTSGKLFSCYVINKNQNMGAGVGSMGILCAASLKLSCWSNCAAICARRMWSEMSCHRHRNMTQPWTRPSSQWP